MRERKGARKREREERYRERNSTLSLRSTEIGPSIFVGARGKVDPCIATYAWVPKSWSFLKLHKVEIFLLGLFLA